MKGLAPSEVIEALRGFDSPTVSNAIEALQVRDRTEGYASRELTCQFPELGPMVGYAVTCTADSTTRGPKRSGRLDELFELIEATPKPVVVVIQDVGHDRTRSCFVGDMIAAAYHRLGVVGVATDGGIRDLSGIRRHAPGLHVFAPGAVVSHGTMARVDLDVSVTVGGLVIEPGDLLHGDESGLLKVPADIVDAIVEQAGKVRDLETEVFDFLAGDSFSMDGLKKRFSS